MQTLQGLTDSIEINERFYESVLKALELYATQFKNDEEKEVVLAFDEMPLNPQLEYDPRNDSVAGLDASGSKKLPIVNSVGVFMMQSLKRNFKQPIGYHFSSGPMRAPLIAHLAKEPIYKLQLTELKLKAFVLDQGTNNVKAISLLTKNSPIIKNSDGSETVLFYDTPHLLKNTRNNVEANGFLIKDEKISWCFIERLLIFNNENELHYCPRLKDAHINIPAFN